MIQLAPSDDVPEAFLQSLTVKKYMLTWCDNKSLHHGWGSLVYRKWMVLGIPWVCSRRESDDIILCLGSHQCLHHVLMLTPLPTFVHMAWLTLDLPCSLSSSTTAENLTSRNEAELQQRCQERQQEIDHMQQVLETKIQLLQEVCGAESDPHRAADFTVTTVTAWRVLPGGPACAQRGRADGFTGWITVPCLPDVPRHPHGGHPRGWEASQNPVTFQHHQRQVSDTNIPTSIYQAG